MLVSVAHAVGPSTSDGQDAEARQKRRMLATFYQANQYYEMFQNSRTDHFVSRKLSKVECIERLGDELAKVQYSLDIVCFCVHNLERPILRMLARSIQVRIVLSSRFRRKLQSFATKILIKGGEVRWAPPEAQLFVNLVLMDAEPGLMRLRALQAPARVLVSMHDKDSTKLVHDVHSALLFGSARAHGYHREFQDLWAKLSAAPRALTH